ncbi:MAG TPA: hypothetical protein DIC59_09840 [Candidatus Competibacteraceae bacterium]|nr:hypothetical protein [Candidatus Competibacteraceae bacterium]
MAISYFQSVISHFEERSADLQAVMKARETRLQRPRLALRHAWINLEKRRAGTLFFPPFEWTQPAGTPSFTG